MNTRKNIAYITILQAFAFLCVVMGHALSLYSETGWYHHWHFVPKLHHINQVIYNFHMPLFFFISGFLLFATAKDFSWLKYNRKRFIRLVVSYYIACIFYCIPIYSYLNISHSTTPLRDWASSFLTMRNLGYLWFLISLYVTSFIFTIVIKTPLRKYPLILLLIFILCNRYPQYLNLPPPFIYTAMSKLIYFYFGYLVAEYMNTIKTYINVKNIALLCIIAFTCFYLKYTTVSAAFFILFFFGLFYHLSARFPNLSEFPLIRCISANMLLLYVLHEPIMIGMLKTMDFGYSVNPYLMALMLFTFDLIICLNLAYLYNQIREYITKRQ